MFDKTLVRFLLVGLFNTVCGLSIIFYLKWALNLGDVSSNLIGYLLGFYISFYMHGRWTYKLIPVKFPIKTTSIEHIPCITCPDEERCSGDETLPGVVTPFDCLLIENWALKEHMKLMEDSDSPFDKTVANTLANNEYRK